MSTLKGFKPLQGASFCCVLGSPIAHSRSPLIHRLFAEQFALALQYERFEIRAGELSDALYLLRELGCVGVNTTLPLKEEAYRVAANLTPRAAAARAGNTLMWDPNGQLDLDNTDGIGLVSDLVRPGIRGLRGSHILLLGAGGAAAGAIPALLDAEPAALVVANRTPTRAHDLVARFEKAKGLSVAEFGNAFPQAFDFVINATSAGVEAAVPRVGADAIGPATVCYDMFYGRDETAFLRWSRAQGAVMCRDGMGMLIEQAAAAFHRWFGQKPDTAPVFAAFGRHLSP